MEDYKRKYSEVSERLMERNRQYQKLQGLYDSLRLRNMVVGVGEKDTLPQAGPHQNFNAGKSNKFTFCFNNRGSVCTCRMLHSKKHGWGLLKCMNSYQPFDCI